MTKKNGFFYFMLEYKKQQEAKGFAIRKMDQVTQNAGKIWEKMDANQREPYVQQAKAANNDGALGKLNCLGFAIAEIDQKLRSKEDHEKMIKTLVAEKVKSAESRQELEKEVMYIISLAYFGTTMKGTPLPAELGVVKYNLQCGVMDTMHMYINPGEIPLGAAYSMQTHTDKTHKLPLPPNAWGTTDKNEVAVRLLSFLAADDEIPPLFTDEETLPMVESMLRELLSNCIEDKVLYVCPLPELFCCVKQATERHFMQKSTFPSALMAQHILKMDSYGFAVGISCEYHERELNMYNCALSQATRWAYTISKYCCLHMGIECVPGKHIPPDISAGEGSSKPATSGTMLLPKQEKPDDSYDAPKSATQKPVAKNQHKEEPSYRPLKGIVSYSPQVGGVPEYVGINPATDETHEDQDAFPSLLQSMGPNVMGRGQTKQRGGRNTRRRGGNKLRGN